MVDTCDILFFVLFKFHKTRSYTSIVVLKGVQVPVCGIDLNRDALKILITHFSCNEKLKEEKYFYKTITDIQRVLKIRKIRNLTLEGKIFF